MIELFVWAPDRETFITGLVENGFATLSEKDGALVPADGVQIDEIGPISRIVGGTRVEPIIETVEGWHVNLRGYGPVEAMFTRGLPQYDGEGKLRPLFERTWLLSIVPGLEWEPLPGDGVPAGYKGPNGVVLYDPAVVATPYRVWA